MIQLKNFKFDFDFMLKEAYEKYFNNNNNNFDMVPIKQINAMLTNLCLLYTSPSPRDS